MSLLVLSMAERAGRRAVGVCVIPLVTACGVTPNTVEKMTESNRLDMMQGMTVQQLCRGYNNVSIGPKTEQQLLELLRDRGVEKCEERGRVRVVPARKESVAENAQVDAVQPARKAEDDAAVVRERQRVWEEAKKREADRVAAEARAVAEAKELEGRAQREAKEKEDPRVADESKVLQELFGPLSPEEIVKIKTVRPANSGEKPRISQAVKRSLIDPESARFGDVFVLPNQHACIAVNGKNQLGGYVGFRMAIASVLQGAWQPLGIYNVTLEKCISMIVKLS